MGIRMYNMSRCCFLTQLLECYANSASWTQNLYVNWETGWTMISDAWDREVKAVATEVTEDGVFQECVSLMERRGWKDYFISHWTIRLTVEDVSDGNGKESEKSTPLSRSQHNNLPDVDDTINQGNQGRFKEDNGQSSRPPVVGASSRLDQSNVTWGEVTPKEMGEACANETAVHQSRLLKERTLLGPNCDHCDHGRKGIIETAFNGLHEKMDQIFNELAEAKETPGVPDNNHESANHHRINQDWRLFQTANDDLDEKLNQILDELAKIKKTPAVVDNNHDVASNRIKSQEWKTFEDANDDLHKKMDQILDELAKEKVTPMVMDNIHESENSSDERSKLSTVLDGFQGTVNQILDMLTKGREAIVAASQAPNSIKPDGADLELFPAAESQTPSNVKSAKTNPQISQAAISQAPDKPKPAKNAPEPPHGETCTFVEKKLDPQSDHFCQSARWRRWVPGCECDGPYQAFDDADETFARQLTSTSCDLCCTSGTSTSKPLDGRSAYKYEMVKAIRVADKE